MTVAKRNWETATRISLIATDKGFTASLELVSAGTKRAGGESMHICHHCNRPTYFPIEGGQFRGAPFGREVKHLPDIVCQLSQLQCFVYESC